MRGTRWSIVAIILVAVAVVYAIGWPQETPDILLTLTPWLDEIRMEGRLAVFAEPFGNYTPPYLYLLSGFSLLSGAFRDISILKSLSLAGTAALSLSVYRLLVAAKAPRPVEASAWVFLLPSVAMNCAWFAQCDAMWTAACVASVCGAVRRNTTSMLIWAGIAVSFKAQASFLAPFLFVILIQQRAPLWHWLIPPAVYCAMMIPAWLIGWPATDLATIYLNQANWAPENLGNASNPWALLALATPGTGHRLMWVGYLAAVVLSAAYIAALARQELPVRRMIAAASLSAMLLPFVLPQMHERFFFLADILTFALAFIGRDMRTISIAVLVGASSTLAVSGYLAASPLSKAIGSPLMFVAIVLVLAEIAKGERPLRGPAIA